MGVARVVDTRAERKRRVGVVVFISNGREALKGNLDVNERPASD